MNRVSFKLVLMAVLAFCAPLGGQSASPPAPSPPTVPAAPSKSLSFGVVEMKNGDRVSGEIKSYAEGRLFVRTPEGDINVKWNNIVSIVSDDQFEIETTAGIHHFGKLAPSDPPGKLVVVLASGAVTL